VKIGAGKCRAILMGPNTVHSPVYHDPYIKVTMVKSAYYVIDYKEPNTNKHVYKFCCTLLANIFVIFKVCKSVHHRTIQISHQPIARIFQFIILTFIYSSTCFGHFPAHHQELNACSGSLWFYLRIVVIVVLCSWSGRPVGWPDHEHSTTVTTIRR
jgi:hypothetical protein